MPQRFFVIWFKYSSLCSTRTKKKIWANVAAWKRGYQKSRFFTIQRLFEPQFIKKAARSQNFFLNVKIKDQVDYQIIAKDQWAMLAERKKMRSYFEKKLCFVTSVRHYEIQQPDLITKNYFLKSRMILLS